jgi:hypothetical protein
MSLSRLDVVSLLVDQFRSIRHATSGKPAVLVRIAIVVIGPLAAGVSVASRLQLQSVSALVGALGLLAGVFLSAFAIVFSMRLTLASRPTSNLKQRSARLMDESALTLLAAALVAGVDAAWIAVLSSFMPTGDAVGIIQTAITIGLSSIVAAYFLMAVRRLYVLYTDTFPPSWRAQKVAGGDMALKTAVSVRQGARARK